MISKFFSKEPQLTVAVLGALRSGTNLLRFLIESNWNIKATFSCYGWKHMGIPIGFTSAGNNNFFTPIVYVTKNPYASLVSLYNYLSLGIERKQTISISGSETFEKFITEPIIVFDSQTRGSAKARFANPIQYWNYVNYNLECLDSTRFQSLGFNYEDLIANPELLNNIKSILKGDLNYKIPKLPTKKICRTTDLNRDGKIISEIPFDLRYYGEKLYLKEYNRDQLDYINQQLDLFVMKRRSYELL